MAMPGIDLYLLLLRYATALFINLIPREGFMEIGCEAPQNFEWC